MHSSIEKKFFCINIEDEKIIYFHIQIKSHLIDLTAG